MSPEQIAEMNPDALLCDGFDDAIIGLASRVGMTLVVAYDTNKIIDILMARDGMDEEEALEFFYFNIEGAWMGENTPVFIQMDIN